MSLDAGVPTNQDCLQAYHQFKMEKKTEFVIFKANDKLTEIVVDVCPAVGESEEKWKELGSKCTVAREKDEPVHFWNLRRLILEKNEPRYAVIMIKNPRSNKEIMTMLFWAPDNAGSKQKMVYSSTKISFKNKLTGIQAMLQCNDLEELSFSEVYKNAMK